MNGIEVVDDMEVEGGAADEQPIDHGITISDLEVSNTDESGTTTTADTDDEPAHAAKPRTREGKAKSIQAEIDRDVARREAAKREADAEEARLVRLRADTGADVSSGTRRPGGTSTAVADDDPEPTLESCDNDENKFLRDYQRWEIREETRKVLATRDARQQQETAARSQQQQVETAISQFDKQLETSVGAIGTPKRQAFIAQVAAVTDRLVPYQPGQPVTGFTAIADSVIASSIPDKLLLHFTANPADFERIGGKPPNVALREVGILEGSLRGTAASRGPASPLVGSAAPPPTKPLGGSPSVSSDSDDADIDDDSPEAFDRYNRRQTAKDARRSRR